jgi:DNA (cytosine-5)-methyltransferase 1
MNQKYDFTFIDLFAGLGGFHLALKQLGGKCVFASELKTDLRQLYTINYPEMEGVLPSGIHKLEGDITAVDPALIPDHDVLCAGFPCQPFSQAGKRQGFKDEKNRGNLFDYICDILECHHPKYVILENVANLLGHDKGNTWKVISEKLDNLGYDIKHEILSPHQFMIPQHRRRIYIVGVDRTRGDINNFSFPQTTKRPCDINRIIDPTDTNILKIRPETRHQLAVWQEFLDQTITHGDDIPTFPIWAMEFGATYKFENEAPAFQDLSELIGRRGHLGRKIVSPTHVKGNDLSLAEINARDFILKQLPNYAQTASNKEFPAWKKRYIEQNRQFYSKHKTWIDVWKHKVENFENSHLKLEWNCGKVNPILEDKIIQFRASGIRVKLPTYSPALNLVGTQIPIFPWIELPDSIIERGEPPKGRYMTIKEAAAIQGMMELDLDFTEGGFPLTASRVTEALGNAVNVTIVKHIAAKLLSI